MTTLGKALTQIDAASLQHLSTDELKRELANQLSLTASALSKASLLWSELTRRGVDLSDLRSGLAIYLPRISRGELAAEAVVAFAGQRLLLQYIAGMPLDEQRRYAEGEKIQIAEHGDDGQITVIERRMTDMTGRQVMLAVADGKIRPVHAQTKSLARQMLAPTKKRRQNGSTARISARDGMIQIGRVRLEPQDLAASLRALGFELVRRGNE